MVGHASEKLRETHLSKYATRHDKEIEQQANGGGTRTEAGLL